MVLTRAGSEAKGRKLADDMKMYGFDVRVTTDPYELGRACRLIITCTTAREPVLPTAAVQPGTHITAMGADAHGKAELEVSCAAAADLVVVDSAEQNVEIGEVARAVEAGVLARKDLVELGDLLQPSHAHLQRGGAVDQRITLFDSSGVAVADAAVAQMVYQELTQAPSARL